MKIREILIECGICEQCVDKASEDISKADLEIEWDGPKTIEFLKTRWLPTQGLCGKKLN